MTTGVFFDTNVLLYLISQDAPKAARAERLLRSGGTISVQVLNEFVDVARRKQRASWEMIGELLDGFRLVCPVQPLTVETHDRAVVLSRRFGFRIYDATIVASALEGGARTLYSEDFNDGQSIDGLFVRNPFL